MKTIKQKCEKLRGGPCYMSPDEIRMKQSAMDLKAKLLSKDMGTGFSHYNFFMKSDEGTSTDFGVFPTESTLAQQSNTVEFDINFLVNIKKFNAWDFFVQEFAILPLTLISKYEHVIPAH